VVAFRREYDPRWRDFELESQDLKAKAEMLSLKLFNDVKAKRVIIEIGREAGFSLDTQLLDDIVSSMKGKLGVSPVDIGISMLVLNDLAQRTGKAHLSVDDYRVEGGSTGVLTAYINDRLNRLSDAERQEMFKVLLALAEPGSNRRIPEGKSLSELAHDSALP